MEHSFDLVVIGAGPGGYVAAIRAAQNGLRTALVERDSRLGGTCLLRGCIPTKALLQTANLMDSLTRAGDFGVKVNDFSLSLDTAMKRKNRLVAKLSAGVGGLIKKYGVTLFRGQGQLAGQQKVWVNSDNPCCLLAKDIILATGSEAKSLPGIDADQTTIVTSDSILQATRVPQKLIVLGSGAVGMEFASLFRSFGSEVAMVECMSRLLPLEDEDVSLEMEKAWRRRKIDFYLQSRVQEVEKTQKGVRVRFSEGDSWRTLEGEMLLMAVGRRLVTAGLGLETVGIELEEGRIPVDGQMRTSVKGIWAIGDLVPSPALAHVAMHEGLVAADTISGKNPLPIAYHHAPSATYSHPETAAVGLTEKKARASGREIKTGVFPFAAIGKASIAGQTEGFVKIVSDARDGLVLGVHIVGLHATELIAEACAALQLNATVQQLMQTIHPHPTLSEAMGEAALASMGFPLHY